MHDFVAVHFTVKAVLSFIVAAGILAPCARYTVWPGSRPGRIPIEYFIAFNITVFIVLGFAVAIIAVDRWAAASLWAGAAMMGGAVVGILFGLPSAADTQNLQASRAAVTDAVNQVRNEGTNAMVSPPAPAHTLLGDTASWLSKFLAGAGFAQARNLLNLFKQVSRAVGGYIDYKPLSANYSAMGSGLLLYFGVLGFLCGLILPNYYVKKLPGSSMAAAPGQEGD